MAHQNKILRVLQLIVCLQSNPPKTKNELTQLIDSGSRTLYRYFELLESIGFKIEKDSRRRYYITTKNLIELETLTAHEFKHLSTLLHTNDKDNPLNKSILDKLAVHAEVYIASDSMGKAHLSKLIEDIQTGIDLKKQIILKNYQSISSQTIADRIVEPISIDNNYRTITAFEVATKKNKTFVVERIKSVEVTPIEFMHESSHLEVEKDIFGFALRQDLKVFPVHLELSLKAKVLLIEEYPKTKPYIKKQKNTNTYIFQCTINDPRPIQRFINGLPKEIKLLENHNLMGLSYYY
jgi:proteasome accessory factor C